MEIISNTPFLNNKMKRLNLEQWSKLVTEWRNSTESQKDFCTRLNLNIHTFTYVKGKLSTKDKQKKFIPITVRQETPFKLVSNIILENAKGMKLHISVTGINDELMNLLKLAGW